MMTITLESFKRYLYSFFNARKRQAVLQNHVKSSELKKKKQKLNKKVYAQLDGLNGVKQY